MGTPSNNYVEWETLKFRLHGFEEMMWTKGHSVTTPELTCFGQRWALQVYPGGANDSTDGMISIFLNHRSGKSCGSFQFAVAIKEDDGLSYADEVRVCTKEFEANSSGWGWSDFIERSRALDALVNGTLVVDVSIKPMDLDKLPFVPKNPFRDAMRKIFLSEKYADVLFEVKENKENQDAQQDVDGDEGTEPLTTTYWHAHRFVLEECAPALADMCGSSCDDVVHVPITGVSKDVFRHLLSYVYGWNIPADVIQKDAKEFIEAADLFGVVNLKLEAECIYIKSTDINVDNVMDILLHATARNCALMKEVALDFIAGNGAAVLDNVCLDDVPGSLFKDLLVATTRREKKPVPFTEDVNTYVNGPVFRTMRVSSLRRRLHAKGLSCDGSREAMIAALKDAEEEDS